MAVSAIKAVEKQDLAGKVTEAAANKKIPAMAQGSVLYGCLYSAIQKQQLPSSGCLATGAPVDMEEVPIRVRATPEE